MTTTSPSLDTSSTDADSINSETNFYCNDSSDMVMDESVFIYEDSDSEDCDETFDDQGKNGLSEDDLKPLPV